MSDGPIMPDVRDAALSWIERVLHRWFSLGQLGLPPKQLAFQLVSVAEDFTVPIEIVVVWIWVCRRAARMSGIQPFIDFSSFAEFAAAYRDFQQCAATERKQNA